MILNRWYITIILCSWWLPSVAVPQLSRAQAAYIKKSIESMVQEVDPHVHIGIEVVSLKNHEQLYHFNEHHLFVPASMLKLFTAATILSLLGYEHRFVTELLIDGTVKKHKLFGDVYLKAAGDPSLTLQDLEALVIQLKESGIKKIKGDFIIDSSCFDEVPLGPGWMWSDGAEFWNSPLAALMVNHSCVKVMVQQEKTCPSEPAKPEGVDRRSRNIPSITLEPATTYVTLENKLNSQPGEKLNVQRRWKTKENVIEVTGCPPSEPQTYRIPVEDPTGYAIALLKDLLHKHGMVLQGSFKRDGKVPEVAQKVANHASAPLIDLIALMLKESDNLYADCFVKHIGGSVVGKAGWQEGADGVRTLMRKNNLAACSIVEMYDGSGKSRYNLVSPHQLVELLVWQRYQENFIKFIKALPHAGVDGTLKDRMQKTAAHRRVWAKTGTMKGISGLAGYVVTRDKEPLAFAIMINNYLQPAAKYKALEDKICEFFAQFSRQDKKRVNMHALVSF
jgi:D-alanyl-D-alanine carboxypeptidase/D-alanyl-D-alanine-endopeptidase (penicillin-binding protein 4)